jgi:transcriptional regulator with XRE-family HTH domain
VVTSDQSRMARAAIDIDQTELSRVTGLSKTTISDYEKGAISLRATSRAKLEGYLSAFVIFVDEEEGRHGPGVLLKEGVTAGSWRNGTPEEQELRPTDDGGEQALEWWRGHPEEWKQLSPQARAAMLMGIYGRVPEVDPIIQD